MYGALSHSDLFSARVTASGALSLSAPTSLCAPSSSSGGCSAEILGRNHSGAWRPTKKAACGAAAVDGSGGMGEDRDRLLQAQQSAANDPGNTDRSQDVARAAQRVIAEANSSARSKASDENRKGLVSCTAAWRATDRLSRGRKTASLWQLETQRKSLRSEFMQLLLRPAIVVMEGTLGSRSRSVCGQHLQTQLIEGFARRCCWGWRRRSGQQRGGGRLQRRCHASVRQILQLRCWSPQQCCGAFANRLPPILAVVMKSMHTSVRSPGSKISNPLQDCSQPSTHGGVSPDGGAAKRLSARVHLWSSRLWLPLLRIIGLF